MPNYWNYKLPKRSRKTLTKRQLRFCEAVVEGKTLTQAFLEAWPEYKFSKWVSNYASKIASDPKIRDQIEQLQQAVRTQFVINAPRALDRLEELAEEAKSEKVKLEANLQILDRAGLGAPQKVEMLHVGIFGNLSAEDVRSLIRKNIDGLSSTRDSGNQNAGETGEVEGVELRS